MYSTRSPFRPAPVTEGLIVSHGSPGDPEPQERFVRRLAERVAARTGIDVRGATLAQPNSLERAVRGMRHPWVFPHFMADGWFVKSHLQSRLELAGLPDWTTLTPLGLMETLPQTAIRRLTDEMNAAGLKPRDPTLVIAAHGSPTNRRPAEVTEKFAETLRSTGLFGAVRVGFVDEEPSIEEAATLPGPSLLLPFFASRAGHVLTDLPEALTTANYQGRVLPPIGTWDTIPLLISHIFQSQRTPA